MSSDLPEMFCFDGRERRRRAPEKKVLPLDAEADGYNY